MTSVSGRPWKRGVPAWATWTSSAPFDDQHRRVAGAVEQATADEWLAGGGLLFGGDRGGEAVGVAADVGHAEHEALEVVGVEGCLHWSAEVDCRVDGAGQAGHCREVAAEGQAKVGDFAVAELPGFADQATDHVVGEAIERRLGLAGAGVVERHHGDPVPRANRQPAGAGPSSRCRGCR
jgi:hypothetical protein